MSRTSRSTSEPAVRRFFFAALFAAALSPALEGFNSFAAASPPPHFWSKSVGAISGADDFGNSVATDNVGNVFVTGTFRGKANFGGGDLINAGSTDIFLAKFDATGAHLWSVGFGATGLDAATSLATDAAGNVVVTGSFSGTVDFGGGGLVSAGLRDAFLAKFDAAGTHLWSQRFGSTGSEVGLCVAVDGTANVRVTGRFAGTVNFGGGNLISAGQDDIFLAKYDTGGGHQWSQRFGSTGIDHGRGLALDGAGNVLVTGSCIGTVDFGGGGISGSGNEDIFLAKYSTTGLHQWSKRFGSAAADIGTSVAVDASGNNVLLTGSFSNSVNFGGGLRTSAGGTDMFLAKYDASGVHQWSTQLGSAPNETVNGIVVDPAGNSVIAGPFTGTVSFGGAALTSEGGTDIFIAKYDASGVHQWSNRFGEGELDQGLSVHALSSGELLVTGSIQGDVDLGGGSLPTPVPPESDAFVAKYDASGAHQWSKRLGSTMGGVDDLANAIAVDGSGNMLVTGVVSGTANFGGSDFIAYGTQAFLVKYDALGAHQWSQLHSSTGGSFGQAVAVDASGNVFTAGAFSGVGNFGGGDLTASGQVDIYLAKYNAAGVHQWSKRFGDAISDVSVAWDIAVDGAGNVIVTGQFVGSVDFGGGVLLSSGSLQDVFVAKYDPAGTHLWSKRFGNSSFDAGRSVAVDASGNVVVTGSFNGTVNFGGVNLVGVGGEEIFLAKYNSAGVHQWSQRFGAASDDAGGGVAIDAAGNAFVTGYFADTTNFGGAGLVSAGGWDIFLAKYNSAGAHQWSQRFGGTLDDIGRSVAIEGSSNVMFTGNFMNAANFGDAGFTSAGAEDIFMAQYDAAGVHQWSQQFGSSDIDIGFAIAANGYGGAVCAGSFRGTVDFGGGGLESVGLDDIFVANYRVTPTGVGDQPTVSKLSLSAQPNPFNPQTTIQYAVPSNGLVDLSVYDARGAHVATLVNREMPAGVHTLTWDGTNEGRGRVGSGVYFARLKSAGNTRTFKLVLLK